MAGKKTWRMRLYLAGFAEELDKRPFTAADVEAAKHWRTCACAELAPWQMLDETWEPIDGSLADLGIEFLDAVRAQDRLLAMSIYERIEEFVVRPFVPAHGEAAPRA